MNEHIHKHTNPLIHESSPYLLQHAHNPVNWHPWGEAALQKAKQENKLIIVSIGYAACHWCHVMEHESFENEKVAEFMNKHFVSIKVDREERPDIDQIYMCVVQLITGAGGWPLNCITLPDGRPIYGGTYFGANQWLNMLTQVRNFVIENPDKAQQQALFLTNGIQKNEIALAETSEKAFESEHLDEIFENWKTDLDYVWGGHNRAPKFPLPIGFQYLVLYHFFTKRTDVIDAVNITLEKMAMGGIYDQIGGGFSRYSVDEIWKVPHFEKMLYDNAQLVSLYSSAYQQSKNALYKTIVNETLEFVNRELTSADGAFYTSLDADSEGVEGKFYVWKFSEIETLLGNEAKMVADYYSVTENGNWENRESILFITQNKNDFAKKHKIDSTVLDKTIEFAKKRLLHERSNRIRPNLDDKILTSWNGLMIEGFIDAYRSFDNDNYLQSALKCAEFIKMKLNHPNGGLYRNFKNNSATINGFLDDYAFMISAYISIYQASFEEKWLEEAMMLTNHTLNHFWDIHSGLFYYTSDLDAELIARKMEITDNVIPASNSEMAKNLFLLGTILHKDEYINISNRMLSAVEEQTKIGGTYYANWDILMTWFVHQPFEVCIVGKDCVNIRKKLDKYYLPNVILSGGIDDGGLSLHANKLVADETMIYVCRGKICYEPSNDIEKIIAQIKS